MNTTVTYRSTETGIRIRIDDENATLDMGHSPSFPDMIRVTELAITYKATEKRDGDAVQKTCEVSRIVYALDDENTPTAFVHPDYLSQPHEWPEWARKLVDEHRPT